MALRSEVARTDNSKLGRAVLNNRVGQQKSLVASNDVVKKKTTKKATTKKTVKKTKTEK